MSGDVGVIRWAYAQLCALYVDQKIFDHAVHYCNEALRHDSTNVLALESRGRIRLEQKKSDLAIADYGAAIRIEATAPRLHGRCRARALADQELPSALADCDEALRIAPDLHDALTSRGLVHLKLGSFDRAAADYDAALKVQPQKAYALYGRGMARLKSGDHARGEADIAEAKSIQTDIAELYASHGVR